MRIVRLDRFPLAIPLAHPMRMAGRTIASTRTFVVRLVTEAREVGWGEANVATALTGETDESIAAALDLLGDLLRGRDARDLRRLSEVMAQAAPTATCARAGVDAALHDAVARSYGVSVSRLLGGDETLDAPSIALVDLGAAGWEDDCRRRLAEGARLIKLKVANGPVDEEISLVRTAVAIVGRQAELAADANGGWSAAETREFCAGVADLPVLFLEQPLAPGRDAEAARLAVDCSVPFGADEAIGGPADIVRCQTDGSARGVALKLLKAGGITPLRDAAALAEGLGLAVNLSGKVGETSIANAALLHVASALPRPSWGVSLTGTYLARDVVREPLPLAGSSAVLAGPGLGVSVDERRLAELAIDAHRERAA